MTSSPFVRRLVFWLVILTASEASGDIRDYLNRGSYKWLNEMCARIQVNTDEHFDIYSRLTLKRTPHVPTFRPEEC